MAVFYHQNNENDKALEVIRKLVKSPGEKKWAFNLWANIISQKEGAAASIEFYDKALQEDPKFELALRNLGFKYFQMDSLSKAESLFERSLEVVPKNWQTVNTLAWVKRRLGNTEDAIQLYEQNVREHPMNLYSYSNYGQFLMEIDRKEEVTSLFQRAEAQNFQNDEFYIVKGNYYQYLEKPDSARYFINKALLFNPKNIDALGTNANLVYNNDGPKEAIPDVLKLLDALEDDEVKREGYLSTLNILAICYYHTEKLDSSFYYINKAIDLAPHFGLLYSTLAEAYYLQGNKEKFYENIIKGLENGWQPSDTLWDDIPYSELKNDQRLLDLIAKYKKKLVN